jgi:cAMP phosphodiesterase
MIGIIQPIHILLQKQELKSLVVAFENTYGLPSIITHTMNVFGERQNPEKYIPMVIKKVRDNEKLLCMLIRKNSCRFSTLYSC